MCSTEISVNGKASWVSLPVESRTHSCLKAGVKVQTNHDCYVWMHNPAYLMKHSLDTLSSLKTLPFFMRVKPLLYVGRIQGRATPYSDLQWLPLTVIQLDATEELWGPIYPSSHTWHNAGRHMLDGWTLKFKRINKFITHISETEFQETLQPSRIFPAQNRYEGSQTKQRFLIKLTCSQG